MTNDKFRVEALKNLRNEEKINERKAAIERQKTERATLDTEKQRLIISIQEGTLTDDECSEPMKKIRQRTAELNIAIANLESQLSGETSNAEIEALDRQLRYDFAHFAEKSKVDQEAVLSQYATAIHYTRHPVTDAIGVSVDFRIGFVRPEFESGNYPVQPTKPPTPADDSDTTNRTMYDPAEFKLDETGRPVPINPPGKPEPFQRHDRTQRTKFPSTSGSPRWGSGLVFLAEVGVEAVEFGAILVGHGGDRGAQAVSHGVFAGYGFPFLGAWTG